MSAENDYLVFIVGCDGDEDMYVEKSNGFPDHFSTFDKAKDIAVEKANKYPGRNITVFKAIATFIAPIGKVEVRMHT